MRDDIDLDALRALHEPKGEHDLICSSCWGSDGEQASWPCETAELIFTQADIDDVLLCWKIYRQSDDGRRYRKRMASGWNYQDDAQLSMGNIYRKMVTDVLIPNPALYFKHSVVPGDSISFTIVNDLKNVT